MKVCLPSVLFLVLLTQCTPVPNRPYYSPYGAAPQQQLTAPRYPTYPAQLQSSVQQQPSRPAYPSSGVGGWQRSSGLRSQSLAGGAQLHEFSVRGAAGSAEVSVVVFDSQRYSLRVLDQPFPNAGGGAINSLMRGTGAIAGVNGGFFHPDFSTLGLMISDGRKTGQFTRTHLITGSFVFISQEPYLIWNHEFLGESGVAQMLQAGPRLVDNGHPVSSLNRTKSATRTFVANDGGRMWAVGVIRSTTLADLGSLLSSSVIPGVSVQRALNLDGGGSSALYARTADGREVSRPGWSTVRNYLAVVPR
jgi:uncharacterized protein YigE (DUF2233 family)